MRKKYEAIPQIRLSPLTQTRIKALRQLDPVLGGLSLVRLCNLLMQDGAKVHKSRLRITMLPGAKAKIDSL